MNVAESLHTRLTHQSHVLSTLKRELCDVLLDEAEMRPLTEGERIFLVSYAVDRIVIDPDSYMRIRRTIEQQYAHINPSLS